MATTIAIPTNPDRAQRGRTGRIIRYYGVGGSNDDSTLTTTACPEHKIQRVSLVTARYSGSPTQTGVTTTIDSGIGPAYDTTINTGAANAASTAYAPDGNIYLYPGDALAVVALAGGSGQTAAITIILEEF